MAITVKKYSEDNYISNKMGIPAHDYLVNTYDIDNNLIQTDYYYGGLQDGGEHVARIVMTYDGNANLLTVERTI